MFKTLFWISICFTFTFTFRIVKLSKSVNNLYNQKYSIADSPKWFHEQSTKNYSNYSDSHSSRIRQLSIFPLDYGQCFPTCDFTLNIFVLKFRQLMNDIQESDGLFGLVMSDPNGDICEYGTVLKNTERKLFIDGRQLCFNKARSRFKVLEIVQTEPYMIVKADIDILDDEVEAAQITGIVPQNIIALEKEIWQCFQDTVNLSNKILKSTDEFRIDGPVKDLSPSSVVLRLNVATDFSFAIAEMLDLNYNERQALLQCLSLTNRLEIIRKYLNDLRNVLLSKVSNSLEDPFN